MPCNTGQSATVTVVKTRSGYINGSASITSTNPIALDPQIQPQSIIATLNGTTPTVNVPDTKGWKWGIIWDGAVQRSDIYTFPYTVTGFTTNKKIQLNANDALGNYGYSIEITPTVNSG